jgi:hypothetical protein
VKKTGTAFGAPAKNHPTPGLQNQALKHCFLRK